MRQCLVSATLVLAVLAAGARSAEPAADEAKAKAAFEAAYEAGTAAGIEKKWAEAEKQFDAALKALGDLPHAKKAVAQALRAKSRDMLKQDAALATAAELLRLKQWAEAEAAYRKAADVLGETDAVKAGIAAAQAGAKAEKDAAAAKPPVPVPVPPPPVLPTPAAKTAADDGAALQPLEIPQPIVLDRDQWFQGAGSATYWEADRLHLQEGDEYLKKMLTKDFAVSIAIEAQMDHRSMISIELRPVKDTGAKARIVGWGSKEGSPPMLAVDRDIKAKGDAQPPQEQITLSFVRTEKKIEFYCNGKFIGHTWDAKLGQPYMLWVCGKGIMNGAKIVER